MRCEELTAQEVRALATHEGLLPAGFAGDVLKGFSWSSIEREWPREMIRKVGVYLMRIGAMEQGGRGIILGGCCGAGKTSVLGLIAAAVYRRYDSMWESCSEYEQRYPSERRSRVLYRTMPDLMDFLLQRKDSEVWDREWSRLVRVRHLMLDEFGTQYSEPFGAQRLFKLLDERWQSPRCTHLATNGDITEMKHDPIGKRLYERMKAKSFAFELPQIDHRVSISGAAGAEFLPVELWEG